MRPGAHPHPPAPSPILAGVDIDTPAGERGSPGVERYSRHRFISAGSPPLPHRRVDVYAWAKSGGQATDAGRDSINFSNKVPVPKRRDYLRAHPEVAARYAALKWELAAQFREDREGYTAAKTAFVREVTDNAQKTVTGSNYRKELLGRDVG